ncbi:MAG: S41 family peptidase [Bacteroidota bacterium]
MIKKAVYGLTALGAGVLIGFIAQPTFSGDNVLQQSKKFNDVLNNTYKNYVDDVDSQKLVEAAIKGMLNELDPHSVYIPAEQMKKVEEDFRGSFDGIGVEFDIVKDTITIVSPISGGPSEALGIQSGDKIIKIDGEKAVGLTREDVPKKLRGPKGTKVMVSIKRAGEPNILDFHITRDKIPLYSVDASFIIDGTDVGYIAANRFAATTHEEIVTAARDLRGQGMKRMILDLRGNPGGFLDQAFKITDEFVSGGKKIVFTKGRREEFNDDFISTDGGEFENIPLVVMINEGSASASEIVSGAIQDLDRGLVVGETSFGKGLVQRQYELGDGSAYRLTISRYYTPSGRTIQRDYKDKDKYRGLEGRAELEEGETATSVDKLSKTDTNRPVFKTSGGRTVLGGGGIVPDYVIKSDTVTPLSVAIRRKNLFWEFTDDYLKGKGSSIRSTYISDYNKFLKGFTITDAILNDFKAVAQKDSIEWNETQAKTDNQFLRTSLKATIARAIWGNKGYTPVFVTMDKQVQKALQLFPEAQKIAKLK